MSAIDKDLKEKANKLCYFPNVFYLDVVDRKRFVQRIAKGLQETRKKK